MIDESNLDKLKEDLGFCPTKTSNAIFEAALWCKDNGQIGLIIGNPGVGKTSALTALKQMYEMETVLVTMNASCQSQSAALQHIHRSLPDAYGSSSRLADIYFHLSQSLAEIGLLLVDEAQHLNDAVIDMLRSLHDEHHFGLVLCGNSKFRNRFNNERSGFGQVISRIAMRPIPFERPLREDVQAICGMHGLPNDCVDFLFHKSQNVGGLRTVDRLITTASQLAVGRPIGLQDLTDAAIVSGDVR